MIQLDAREVVVVSVGVPVPHVGGEVAVDVGVAEVRGEAEAEDEASEDTQPASRRVAEAGAHEALHTELGSG